MMPAEISEMLVNFFRGNLPASEERLKTYKATRSPEISREQVQKQTPQFVLYIYWI